MMNYSIIIPHKNIPDLLQRCLDSIPRREDVQIIIVDDNSDPDVVDFEHFPGLNDSYVEVYFTKKGKGAGYARNIGLEHAKGKWIIFADADDMFLDNIGDYLDKCKNLNYEVIMFNYVSKRLNGELRNIESITPKFPPKLLLKKCFPWCKVIRKVFLDTYNIKFQEVQWSNDLMFAVKLAKYAKTIFVDTERVYMQIERYGSLCKKVTWQSLYCRTKVALKAYYVIRDISEFDFFHSHYLLYWKELLHRKKLIALLMLPRICYIVGIKIAIKDFYERLKIDYPNFFK